jgi:hypothetical protein
MRKARNGLVRARAMKVCHLSLHFNIFNASLRGGNSGDAGMPRPRIRVWARPSWDSTMHKPAKTVHNALDGVDSGHKRPVNVLLLR